MNTYCKCGKPNAADANFCCRCGTSLKGTAKAPKKHQDTQSESLARLTPSRKRGASHAPPELANAEIAEAAETEEIDEEGEGESLDYVPQINGLEIDMQTDEIPKFNLDAILAENSRKKT